MKVSKRQLQRIIREEKRRVLHEQEVSVEEIEVDAANGDHHWPRVDWNDVATLVDKWHDMEMKSYDPGDPSMAGSDDMSATDAKDWWREQADSASMDLEADLTVAVRKLALAKMKEFSEKLLNGEYT